MCILSLLQQSSLFYCGYWLARLTANQEAPGSISDYSLETFLEFLGLESTAMEQVVVCALVTQRARVRSPVGTCFLGDVFSGFFLTCKTNVRKL